MKQPYEEIINKLKEHMKLEETSIRRYSRTLSRIKNRALKEILKGILIDSIAHRELLKAVINVLNKISKEEFTVEAEVVPVKDIDAVRMIEALKKHVKAEEETIKDILSIAEKLEIYSLKETLRILFEDEVRHHTILSNIIETFEKYHKSRGCARC